MISDNKAPKTEEVISKVIMLFVFGLMLLFGTYGVYHLLHITSEGSPIRLYVYFVLALALFTTAFSVVGILQCKHWKIEKVSAFAMFSLGLLYMFAMTPLSVPDEKTHYQSAYVLSNYLCFQWDESGYGRTTDFDYTGFEIHKNVSSAYSRIVEGVDSEKEDKNPIPISDYALAYPLEYVPQALGISIGRLFHTNFIVTFFLGRLVNLLFYALCVYFAIKTVTKFKLLFSVISLLPMALHQAASYSYDSFVNGLSLLLIALILRSIWDDSRFRRKEALQICAVSILLAPAKLIYWVITLMVILIPRSRFSSIRQRVLFVSVVLVAPLILAGLLQFSMLSSITVQSADKLNWEGVTNYTVGFILHHPIQTVRLFVRSFIFYAAMWFECSIGAILSGLSLKISIRTIYVFVLLLLVSSQYPGGSGEQVRSMERAVLMMVSLMVVLLVMLTMFLAWTANTRSMVEGVQGRYFIPILPLLFLSCNNGRFKVMKPLERPVLLASLFLNLHVIVQVLAYTVMH